MKKIIKKQANSLCIILTREDREIYGFKEGDIIDIQIKKEANKKWVLNNSSKEFCIAGGCETISIHYSWKGLGFIPNPFSY